MYAHYKLRYSGHLDFDEFRVAFFLQVDNMVQILRNIDAIDKKYISSQWFNFAFVYDEKWIYNYAQLGDRCNIVPTNRGDPGSVRDEINVPQLWH